MTRLKTLSGKPVSRLTFGTMQFGGAADEAASRLMFAATTNAGINHFDTANGYTDGHSERILGAMVSAVRDDYFVATKAGFDGGAGRANLTAQFEDSRQRLDVDCVDLLYLHRWDDSTPLDETFETLAELQQNGKVRHIGVSNFAAWQVMKAQAVAAAFDTRIDAIQPMYNLVKRQAEVELFPMAIDQGIAIFPYSPLGGGLLTGKYSAGETGRLTEDQRYAARYGPDWMHHTAHALAELAAAHRVPAATLAVAWAKAHPASPSPIISARSVEQLESSLDAMNLDLHEDLYAQISALSRTPAPATDRLEEA